MAWEKVVCRLASLPEALQPGLQPTLPKPATTAPGAAAVPLRAKPARFGKQNVRKVLSGFVSQMTF